MNKYVIALDVDLCVVDPAFGREGLDWYSWLLARSKGFVEDRDMYADLENNCCEYNLSKYFVIEEGVNVYDFWRQENLYDLLTPVEGAVEVVSRLCEKHEVVFVSYCKTGHTKSKYNFCKRWFSGMSGFLSTKEKGYVKADIFIDDRNEFLNQTSAEHRIKMLTPYTQDVNLEVPVINVTDWYDLEKKLEKFLDF